METKPRGKRQRLFPFQLIFTVGLLSLIWFSFGQNVLAPLKQRSAPERLGDLPLVNSVEGTEALTQIDQLHGTTIDLVSAYIAHYARNNERVTVWVGKAENKDAASELLRRMIEGIARGDSGFSNLKQLSIAQGYHSHEVFQAEGSGGKHFFYQSRQAVESVVWLTIEATDAMPILELAIEALE